jgi:hypothetical protein
MAARRNACLVRFRNAGAQGGVGPPTVVLSYEFLQDRAQVPLVDRDHVVQAFESGGSVEPFTESFRFGARTGVLQDAHAEMLDREIEGRGKYRIGHGGRADINTASPTAQTTAVSSLSPMRLARLHLVRIAGRPSRTSCCGPGFCELDKTIFVGHGGVPVSHRILHPTTRVRECSAASRWYVCTFFTHLIPAVVVGITIVSDRDLG